MDKHTDIGICLEKNPVVKSFHGVVLLENNNTELLNAVYREINEEFGIDVAMRIYQMYKGTQVSFPVRFLNPDLVKQRILKEYSYLSTSICSFIYNMKIDILL